MVNEINDSDSSGSFGVFEMETLEIRAIYDGSPQNVQETKDYRDGCMEALREHFDYLGQKDIL